MNKKRITITSYAKCKTWDNGGQTFSFKLNSHTRAKINSLPDGTYINVSAKPNPTQEEVSEGNTHYVYGVVNEAAPQPAQQPQQPPNQQLPF